MVTGGEAWLSRLLPIGGQYSTHNKHRTLPQTQTQTQTQTQSDEKGSEVWDGPGQLDGGWMQQGGRRKEEGRKRRWGLNGSRGVSGLGPRDSAAVLTSFGISNLVNGVGINPPRENTKRRKRTTIGSTSRCPRSRTPVARRPRCPAPSGALSYFPRVVRCYLASQSHANKIPRGVDSIRSVNDAAEVIISRARRIRATVQCSKSSTLH